MRFDITDNVVVRFLSKVSDLVCLNVLWIIFSLPIITIGASTTAMFTVLLKMVKNEEGYILKPFLSAFRSNLKKGTLIWIVVLLLGGICVLDFSIIKTMPETIAFIMQSLLFLLLFFVLSLSTYAFALTARYENTVKATLKNALLLTIGKLPYSLLIVGVLVAAIVATLWSPATLMIAIPIWVLIGVSFLGWIDAFLLRRVFLIFEEDEDEITGKNEKM